MPLIPIRQPNHHWALYSDTSVTFIFFNIGLDDLMRMPSDLISDREVSLFDAMRALDLRHGRRERRRVERLMGVRSLEERQRAREVLRQLEAIQAA